MPVVGVGTEAREWLSEIGKGFGTGRLVRTELKARQLLLRFAKTCQVIRQNNSDGHEQAATFRHLTWQAYPGRQASNVDQTRWRLGTAAQQGTERFRNADGAQTIDFQLFLEWLERPAKLDLASG